jgi:hypothetical protein
MKYLGNMSYPHWRAKYEGLKIKKINGSSYKKKKNVLMRRISNWFLAVVVAIVLYKN